MISLMITPAEVEFGARKSEGARKRRQSELKVKIVA
jgi:hypothetical protein